MDENEVVEDDNLDVEEVPAELQGLSEETIKETMAEVNESEEDSDDDESEEVADVSTAEPDSVNKQSMEAFEKPKQKIPYERFKTEVDKNKAMKAEMENLKAELERMKSAVTPTTPAQTQQQIRQEPSQKQPQFTDEQVKTINDAIQQEALSISGLSKDDVDSIPYMDDDDERIARWKVANNMATTKVMATIEQARQAHAAKVKEFMDYHNRMAASYNSFVQEQQSDPNFEAIKAYATGAYFESLSPDDQPIISDAYVRIDHNNATPQDIALIKRFFMDAKQSFKKKGGRNLNAAKQAKQSTALPRADKVEGSAASIGSPSVAALERMLNEKSWDEIPDEYKRILKGL